ncbi:unnamed protein product [Spirodela intermedia]|uniref:Uncharacterized protein n=1 Tax=Spirodela intermedia TaxID=51605 RepID=A0A7I8J3G6_SPIIN|nr:unnamed protein product [Spirodela intermedia]CAA6663890.1 unnamed protein product [Spirodela intermedia]
MRAVLPLPFQIASSPLMPMQYSFDDDSLKVAELLVKNGFKEAYAIKGGVRGKEGWQAIQETLLPPSVHVYPRKKTIWGEGGISGERGSNGYESNDQVKTSRERPQVGENGQVKGQGEASERGQSSPRSSSPYPNYPDLKPPSSPTPSKP